GTGAAILQSGPTYVQSGCSLKPRSPVRSQGSEGRNVGAGDTQAATTTGPNQPGAPQTVSLKPYALNSDDSCALFIWYFTALRSGSVSFSGTAEGRLLAESPGSLRLLSLLGGAPRDPGQVASGANQGGQITAPIATAADSQV